MLLLLLLFGYLCWLFGLADSRAPEESANPMIQPWPAVIRQPSQPSAWAYSQLAGSSRAALHHLFTTTRAAREIRRRPSTTCRPCTVPAVCYICSRRDYGCQLDRGQGAGCLDSYLILSLGHRSNLADSAHCCLSRRRPPLPEGGMWGRYCSEQRHLFAINMQ